MAEPRFKPSPSVVQAIVIIRLQRLTRKYQESVSLIEYCLFCERTHLAHDKGIQHDYQTRRLKVHLHHCRHRVETGQVWSILTWCSNTFNVSFLLRLSQDKLTACASSIYINIPFYILIRWRMVLQKIVNQSINCATENGQKLTKNLIKVMLDLLHILASSSNHSFVGCC